jgi:lia operon protein LiaF
MRKTLIRLIGYGIALTGMILLFHLAGLQMLLGSLILAFIGIVLLRQRYRILGLGFLVLALITLFHEVFRFDIAATITTMAIGTLMIYAGVRLLRQPANPYEPVPEPYADAAEPRLEDALAEEPPIRPAEAVPPPGGEPPGERRYQLHAPLFQTALIGDWQLFNQQLEWTDIQLSYGLGDVKIDLTKALIPEGESAIVISGLVGDVDIYVPYDLDLAVAATVVAGNLEVLGHRQNGINRQVQLATKGYKTAPRRVKICVSLLIGDVDVRYL